MFSQLHCPPRLYPCLRFTVSLAVAAQDSGPSGSLVLAPKNFAFSASYRLSGKAMALIGLRMMPTFPSPPLKFRTASFPRYGFKAGRSDKAFPKPGLPSSFVPTAFTVYSLLCVRDDARVRHLRASAPNRSTQGPSLRSGLCCPGPSSLNRPHPPLSRAHPDFAAWRFIRDALAVPIRIGLGNPRLVLSFPGCSFTTCRPLRPRGTLRLLLPSTSPKTLAFNLGVKFRHSLPPHTPILVSCAFSRLDYGSLTLRPVVLLALLSELTRLASSHRGRLHPASDGLVTRPVAGYHYSANWVTCTARTFTC